MSAGRFQIDFYDCLYTRADALFELAEAVLCTDGPVKSLVELTLEAEHRRGHGAMYDALNTGWLEPTRFRRLPASQLVLQAPPPVVAQALGYHNKSATRIATEAGAPWKSYAPGDHTR